MFGAPLQGSTQDADTLVSSQQILAFVLEAAWAALDGDRGPESEERPGLVRWISPDDREIRIPIEIKTRGNYRLQKSTCFFPPLRLDFPRNGTAETVFRSQDKLKLVTHCRDRENYEQNVLEEYLAYRIYNVLTDISFLVRPARITYVDLDGDAPPITHMGFIIEHKDAMASRLGGRIMDVPGAPPSHFQQDQAALMYLFQFMIGNTDWAMFQFHNLKTVGVGPDFFPVPYDFDWSGLVDAPYAGPNPVLTGAIESVRDRLYMGYCHEAIDYQQAYSRIMEKKDEILELPGSTPGLSEENRRWAAEYLLSFFEIIENPSTARARIQDACRSPGG